MLISKNPATEEILAEYDEFSDDEIDQKLSNAQKTFKTWRDVPFNKRSELMLALATLLRIRKEDLASIMTKEMGKTITSSIAEVEKCALVCEYYALETENFLKPEDIETEVQRSYVRFDPLGSILAIMPWNFPFWQVFRFAAPALMAGNAGILKHASNVPQCALAIEKLFIQSGFPSGIFQSFLVGSHKVEQIIQREHIKAVTLTGSEEAGSIVASQAGREIKKTVLELGGSDPFIVLEDADIQKACEVGVQARLVNAGQSCIAAKRFIVAKSVVKEFVDLYQQILAKQILGDPMDKKTTVGPLATEQILETVESQVRDSIQKGARLVVGGKRFGNKGYYYEPTILTDVTAGMAAYDEEVFGPVIAVIAAEDEEDSIRIANDHRYGLGASLWTKDLKRAEIMARQIEAGFVAINSMVKSDPRLPFGGIKKSGYGRELSHYGIREFVNIKTVTLSK